MAFKKMRSRKKQCYFKKNHIKFIDYKDVETLKKFVSSDGKITPRSITGTSAKRTNPILRFRTNRIHPDDEAKSELDRPSWAVFSYVSPLASSIIGLGMMSPI